MDHLPPGPGFWAVVGHAECNHVVRTPSIFSSALGLTQVYDAPPPLLKFYRSMMINMDPPQHTRLRKLLGRSFTPSAVRKLEDGISARARTLVDAVTPPTVGADGACDFARDVVAELPLQTLADMLGMPESDRWLMFDWANRVIGMLDDEYGGSNSFDPARASDLARQAIAARPQPDENGRMPDARHPAGMADLYAYARGLAEQLRAEPGEDIMSGLLQQTDDADPISVQEFENVFWLLCVAGNETVRNALPGGLQALLEHPAAAAQLWADPSLLPSAVDEMLRWWSPVVHFRRTATQDTELGGAQIAAGEKVVVFFSAANRDPRVFSDPDDFDIRREPNPHIAFGAGPHYCIGAMLARAQMISLFSEVVHRWEGLRPDGDPVRLRASFQNGIKSQPVTFQTRQANADRQEPGGRS